MAKINQNTIQQIKGSVDPVYTEKLTDSIPTNYTRKGSKPRPHVYPTEEVAKAAKEYEDIVGITKIHERKAKKDKQMKEFEQVKKIITQKKKARKAQQQEEYLTALAEHETAVNEYYNPEC